MGLSGRTTPWNRRRTIAAALAAAIVVVALMVSVVSLASAADTSFPDVYPTNPYYSAITSLAGRGIITGFPNGNFGPNDAVTRQQFAKMIVLAGNYPVSESDICPFTDVVVSGPGNLYPDNYVAVCAANGITVGKTPTTFDPYANITRYQVVSMVVRAADDLHPGLLKSPPAYWVGTGAWENDATHGADAARAEFNGLLAGFDLPTMNPGGYMTRGEVAQILCNLLQAFTPPTTTTTAHTTTTTVVTTTTTSSTTTSSTTSTTAVNFEKLGAGGQITSGPAVASWGEKRLDVFARGPSGQLLQLTYASQWDPSWSDLGGSIAVDSRPAAVAGAVHPLDVFARGTDNALWHKYYANSSWSRWESVDATLTSAPAACSILGSSIYIVARGSDGALWETLYDAGSWSAWDSLDDTVKIKAGTDPAVISWGPGRIDIFICGVDNTLWHKAWVGSVWGTWESLGGALTSSPTVSSRGEGSLDLFVRGPDGKIWQKSLATGVWGDWTSQGGGKVTSAPAAISWDSVRIDLFARGTDGDLVHRMWNGVAWVPRS